MAAHLVESRLAHGVNAHGSGRADVLSPYMRDARLSPSDLSLGAAVLTRAIAPKRRLAISSMWSALRQTTKYRSGRFGTCAHASSWSRVVIVGILTAFPMWGAASLTLPQRVRAASIDCNANGIADDRDTLPLQFDAGIRFPAGGTTVSVAAADFDGDGDVDFAVTSLLDGTVSILLNNGFGLLGAPKPVRVGGSATGIVAADLDGDGVADLAVATSSAVTVLHNDGHAGFTQVAKLAADSTVESITVADFDRDGHPDLAFSSFAGTVFIAHSMGDGNWKSPVVVPLTAPNGAVAAADLDSDGDADLVLGNGTSIALNNGDGTFAPPIAGPIQPGSRFLPTAVAIGDLDHDGDVDLALPIEGPRGLNTVIIELNRGDGTFLPGVTISLPAAVSSSNKQLTIAIGDIDGDGDLDLAVANNYALVTSVLRNGGDATFAPPENYVTGSGSSVLLRDVDGDGDLDLAVLAGPLVLTYNDGQGRFVSAPLRPVPERTDPLGGPVCVVAADLDGDGLPDLATANRADNSVSILRNQGGRSFAPPTSIRVADAPSWIAAADVDGDGRIDLAVTSYANQLTLLHNNGSGQFAVASTLPVQYPSRVEFARLHSDANPGLVVASGQLLDVFRNAGNGQLAQAPAVDLHRFITALAVADFDRDGKDEVVVAHNFERAISLVTFQNDGTAAVATFDTPEQPIGIAALDVDADGAVDVVVSNDSPNVIAAITPLTLLRNDGTGHLLPPVDLPLGIGGPITGADLDGDGRIDFVIRSTVVRNYGLDIVPRPIDFAVWPDVAMSIVADLDGDRRPDIVVAHSGSGAISAVDPGGLSLLWNETLPASSRDCNLNRVPDECEVPAHDCDANSIPDDCEVDSDHDAVPDACDHCPGKDDRADSDADGTPDCLDGCPTDPAKLQPGQCGCGRPDIDTDGDAVPDCIDNCPDTPNPMQEDRDHDGVGDACDQCPDDRAKRAPQLCGCGQPETDSDGDGTPDCLDECQTDANKVHPGVCGCGRSDLDGADGDGDGVPNCIDLCPGSDDRIDTDADGIPDCADECPTNPALPSSAEPLVYIASEGTNEVLVLDAATNRWVGRIPVGARPVAVEASADARWVFAANFGSDSVSIIDTTSQTVTHTIDVAAHPVALAQAGDGASIYVASYGYGTGTLTVIDPALQSVRGTIAVGGSPLGIAVSPDGRFAFVANGSGGLRVIDTTTGEQVQQFGFGFVSAVSATHDGSGIWDLGNVLSFIDLHTGIVTGVGGFRGTGDILVSPRDDLIYATPAEAQGLLIIDARSRVVVSQVPLGRPGGSIGATPDGERVYVTGLTAAAIFGVGPPSSAVSVIDTALHDVVEMPRIGSHTTGIAVTPRWAKDANRDAVITVADVTAAVDAVQRMEQHALVPDANRDCRLDQDDVAAIVCAVFREDCLHASSPRATRADGGR